MKYKVNRGRGGGGGGSSYPTTRAGRQVSKQDEHVIA